MKVVGDNKRKKIPVKDVLPGQVFEAACRTQYLRLQAEENRIPVIFNGFTIPAARLLDGHFTMFSEDEPVLSYDAEVTLL